MLIPISQLRDVAAMVGAAASFIRLGPSGLKHTRAKVSDR